MGRNIKAKGVGADLEETVIDLPEVEQEVEQYVWVCSLRDANIYIEGKSGTTYHFPKAGAMVKVTEEDAQYFIGLRKRGCCGGTVSPLFELVSGG